MGSFQLGPDPHGLYAGAVDRDHARVPAALPRLLRVRRRSSRRRAHAARGSRLQGPGSSIDGVLELVDKPSAAAPVDRRRRAAGALPRARHAAAAPGRARHPRAARHERGREIPHGWREPAALQHRRLDRRPAARTRRAADAGDLRSHPEAHRRAPDHGALHR